MKKSISFPVDNFIEFKNRMLNWAQPFNIFCFLDNSRYNFEKPAFECMLAAGCSKKIEPVKGKVFEALKVFSNTNDWLFGHLCYDLKNETSSLKSSNFDGINFEDCCFFVPEIVLQLHENSVTIFCEINAQVVFDAIVSTSSFIEEKQYPKPGIKNRISAEAYLHIIEKLQQHILRGDCYEINFCQEFFSDNAVIDPLTVFVRLTALSPNPFAAFYKIDGLYCICASPERYFKKTGNKVYAQPIKGTARRNLQSIELDEQSRQQLIVSEKDKSENVMVVDLVRNDLSKVCKEGTIKVEELFGIYSFPQVHQMISTISGELKEGTHWTDIVMATFPMGSMTGAPKKRVMEIIEQYEQTKRGLFSGAIGYIEPNGNADFNVVIRSILYNANKHYISFQAGSAITFYSDPAEEYRECLMKISAMRETLE